MVRQAAAGFVLAEYLLRSGDAGLVTPVERALRFYVANAVKHGDGALVSGDATLAQANAGATAFALLAELYYAEATGRDTFAVDRFAWLQGLLALQRPGGGFRRSPDKAAESSYYNGEAWLALAYFERRFPRDPAVASALGKADAYLMSHYAQVPDTQFAHWGLMAASVRYETTRDPRFLDFIETLGDTFVTRLKPRIIAGTNSCSMVEGLAAGAAALKMGGRTAEPYDRMVERARAELAKSLAFQIAAGQNQIALGRERFLQDPLIGEFAGAFLDGLYLPLARVDSTQHCLSALMKYQALEALAAD